jgi:hypothetical protein
MDLVSSRSLVGRIQLPGATQIAIVASASLAGLLRSVQGPRGDLGVLLCLGILLLSVSFAGAQVATGRRQWLPALALGALALPLALAGASTVAYPGLGGLSSAEHAIAGEPLGTANARLTLYPTSFVALAGVARLTGLDVVDLLQWSWVLSLPIMVGGFGLFVREWTGSRTAGAIGMLICISNPWFFIVPIYDGLNLTLLPIWSYVLLRSLKRVGPGPVLCSVLLIAVIVTSHFFTSLFAIACALAIAAGLWIRRGIRGRSVVVSGQDLGGLIGSAALIPLVAILAWLVYVSERYLRESVGLVLALLNALDHVGSNAGVIGLGLVSPAQIAILLSALGVYGIAALTLSVHAVRIRSRRAVATLAVAAVAIPLVVWAIVTPPQFSLGTDLKEWKVRPLFGAFVLVAPMLALGLIGLARVLPNGLRRPLLAIAIGAILVNAQTLSLGYGSLGPRTYTTAGPPTSVEDGTLAAAQYRSLGDYVRERLPRSSLLVADWRQSNWMVGVGGLDVVPLYEVPALADDKLLGSFLDRPDIAGIAVDRNLLGLKSIYHDQLAAPEVVDSLDNRDLNRVFDSGDQVLYLRP